MDEDANERRPCLGRPDSRRRVDHSTNEELMIAQHTRRCSQNEATPAKENGHRSKTGTDRN